MSGYRSVSCIEFQDYLLGRRTHLANLLARDLEPQSLSISSGRNSPTIEHGSAYLKDAICHLPNRRKIPNQGDLRSPETLGIVYADYESLYFSGERDHAVLLGGTS